MGAEADGDSDSDSDADSDADADADASAPTVAVDYRHLQHPCRMSAAAGATSDAVYCWVYQAGVTGSAGQGAGLSVEVGHGVDGADPLS